MDPRSDVEAPVRGALIGVIGRGIALVGLMAFLAVWPVAARPSAAVRDGITFAALGVLVAYALAARLATWRGGRPSDAARRRAWARAREIDGDDAALGLLVAGWVPAGLLLATGLVLWPHLTDANPALAAAWVVLSLPPFIAGWAFATLTWLDACRDDLARAQEESDVRFRRYWADPGR